MWISVYRNAGFFSSSLCGKCLWPRQTLFNPNTPSLTVVNSISDVQGHVGGFISSDGVIHGDMGDDIATIIYPIAGDVYATVTDDDTGVTQGAYVKEGSISATVLLDGSFFGLLGPWDQIPTSTLPWTMSDDFAMIRGFFIVQIFLCTV